MTTISPNWPAIEAALFADPLGLTSFRYVDEGGQVCAVAALCKVAGTFFNKASEQPGLVESPASGGAWTEDFIEARRKGFTFFGLEFRPLSQGVGDNQILADANNAEPDPLLRPIRALNALRSKYGLPPRPLDWRPPTPEPVKVEVKIKVRPRKARAKKAE